MKWLAIVVAALAASWAWIALGFPDHAHRFRFTAEVETPDGPRSGSSVIEVERKDVGWLPVPGPRHEFRVRGEAVFLDLGPGRDLVAVLAHGDNAGDVDQTISLWVEAYGRYRWDEDVRSGRTELRGVVELRPPLIPTLVALADPLVPSTVRVVPPDGFEAVFGPGFRFRRATLEVAPASVPVTSGTIEQRLPWPIGMTTNLAGKRHTSTDDIRERLGPRSFKRQDP